VQDAEAYQRLLDIAARADSDEGIRQGLDDVAHGRTRPANEVFDDIRRKHGISHEFADRAARDLEALYVEKSAAEFEAASRWYNGLEEQSTRLRPARIAVLQLRKLEG